MGLSAIKPHTRNSGTPSKAKSRPIAPTTIFATEASIPPRPFRTTTRLTTTSPQRTEDEVPQGWPSCHNYPRPLCRQEGTFSIHNPYTPIRPRKLDAADLRGRQKLEISWATDVNRKRTEERRNPEGSPRPRYEFCITNSKVFLRVLTLFSLLQVVIIQPVDSGNKAHPFGHALVAGIERYPSKVTRRMSKSRQEKRSKIKPFVKAINYNHLMPTRYTLELEGLKGALTAETFKEVSQREDAKKNVKKVLEERYISGKNRWFFTPLRTSSLLSSLLSRGSPVVHTPAFPRPQHASQLLRNKTHD